MGKETTVRVTWDLHYNLVNRPGEKEVDPSFYADHKAAPTFLEGVRRIKADTVSADFPGRLSQILQLDTTPPPLVEKVSRAIVPPNDRSVLGSQEAESWRKGLPLLLREMGEVEYLLYYERAIRGFVINQEACSGLQDLSRIAKNTVVTSTSFRFWEAVRDLLDPLWPCFDPDLPAIFRPNPWSDRPIYKVGVHAAFPDDEIVYATTDDVQEAYDLKDFCEGVHVSLEKEVAWAQPHLKGLGLVGFTHPKVTYGPKTAAVILDRINEKFHKR